MAKAAFVFTFATVIGLAALARAEDVCTVTRIAAIQMRPDSDRGVQVPMQISGHTVNLLVDTAGVVSMLSEKTVKTLSLYQQSIQDGYFMEFGGTRITNYVVAHDIEFGGLKASQLDFLVLPGSGLSDEIEGTLAPDILRSYDVDFDFGASTFKLYTQDHCPGKVVYWATDYAIVPFTFDRDKHIRLEVTLDGKVQSAILDSGSTHSIMSLEMAEDMFDFDSASPGLTTLPTGAGFRRYRYGFKTMTFGGVTVNNPDIELVPDRDSHMHSLILGVSILHHLHLYIAYREHKLYVTPADAH
ncbi:MAG: retropepsin-like domain-containing protein [Proteobacteria bacterium]|nr:retropepsin-like domain-containing protein [Pseudomonadota bacterium]